MGSIYTLERLRYATRKPVGGEGHACGGKFGTSMMYGGSTPAPASLMTLPPDLEEPLERVEPADLVVWRAEPEFADTILDDSVRRDADRATGAVRNDRSSYSSLSS